MRKLGTVGLCLWPVQLGGTELWVGSGRGEITGPILLSDLLMLDLVR